MAATASTGDYRTGSAELEALKLCFNYLVDSIDTASILPHALSTHLISDRQRSECDSERESYKQAEKFLGYLQRAVNGDSNKYHTFVQILKNTNQETLAMNLQEELNKATTEMQQPSRETLLSPTIETNTEVVDGEDDDAEEQITVPKVLLDELVGLRVAYARLLNRYKKVIQSSPEAQSEFVEILPELLEREITSSDVSFQSYFKILKEEEVSLFNITYLKKISDVIFTDDIRTQTKDLADTYEQQLQHFMSNTTVNQFKELFPASATSYKLSAGKVPATLKLKNTWGKRTLNDLRKLVDSFAGEYLHLSKLRKSSIAITWLCPTTNSKEFKANIQTAEYSLHTKGVLQVFFEERLELDCSKHKPERSSHYFHFVKMPEQDDFFCPICTELLLQPFLTTCGHYVCCACRDHLLQTHKNECSTCREPDALKKAQLNKHLQRQINSVKVYCHNRGRGCTWEGEVRYLQYHSKKECKVPCSFDCGSSIYMFEMKHHKREKCSKRPATCELCGYHNAHDIVTEKHYPVCLQFSEEQIVNQAVAITPPPATVSPQYLYNLPPVVFTITDYQEKKQANEMWTSPPYYTKTQGYKFCLKVGLNGQGKGKDTHISVSAHLMRGEYDDKLQWPFEGGIIFKLLNWRADDKDHFSKSVDLNKDRDPKGTRTSRVINKEIAAAGYSYSRFISHAKLDYNPTTDTEYLQDDCLKIELNVVNYSTTHLYMTPSWQDSLTTNQSVCEFTLTDFSIRKHFNNRSFSPPFYTHSQGHKMYLEVYANGQSSGEGTHVSILATFMRGEHDQHFQGPFTGDIIIELLNWREDKEHHTKTLSVRFITERKKSSRKYHCYKFISHSTIDTKYLQDDCLRLRVSVALYSTALLHKTPSWQDSLTTTHQSVCEFTLTEFSKRKQFNNRYFSPPFYTHPQGYKLYLVVCANGKHYGKGNSISIFAYLMKGDHDDSLKWPFEGTIIIELLNWKEDKEHHEKCISFNKHVDPDGTICGRVTKGNYTTDSWGRYQFISHSSLYNSTINTEYLQEDCLRLRVKEIVYYSTALLNKTPSWQPDPTTKSVCEFTLTDFSKRKQFNNEYASPPFYTHDNDKKYGYKMIIFVVANGYKSAEGTHISVRLRLMKGEHDNDLCWPFVGNVIVELLNWRKDDDHQVRTLELNSSTDPDGKCTTRVTRGHFAEKAWFNRHDLFSHSSLPYNSTTNTEYLQDDCLRLRVRKVRVYSV